MYINFRDNINDKYRSDILLNYSNLQFTDFDRLAKIKFIKTIYDDSLWSISFSNKEISKLKLVTWIMGNIMK